MVQKIASTGQPLLFVVLILHGNSEIGAQVEAISVIWSVYGIWLVQKSQFFKNPKILFFLQACATCSNYHGFISEIHWWNTTWTNKNYMF